MSETWIRGDMDFGVPEAVLTLPWRDPFVARLLALMGKEGVAELLEEDIERRLPALQGVRVWAMQFEVRAKEVHLYCVHPSFARVAFGEPAPKIGLPSDEGDALMDFFKGVGQ